MGVLFEGWRRKTGFVFLGCRQSVCARGFGALLLDPGSDFGRPSNGRLFDSCPQVLLQSALSLACCFAGVRAEISQARSAIRRYRSAY